MKPFLMGVKYPFGLQEVSNSDSSVVVTFLSLAMDAKLQLRMPASVLPRKTSDQHWLLTEHDKNEAIVCL